MTAAATLERGKRRTALIMAGVALGMLGLGFAAVPLYRIFCQVTGFGGTTMRVSEARAATVKAGTQTISVRFDANVDRGLGWRFQPQQVTQDMRIGQRKQAFYWAENTSSQSITGVASFNVEPEQAGKYFNKIQCFCFNQQTLQPGQKVDMPVIYYVDPAIATDPETKDIQQITLSYTFHRAADGGAKILDRADPAR
ncbi:cytochrome c oxidase assembly protein subunit 11 [Novosphingobium kunmingense]|uniref:Cytochrome c oxidase assembly protein CtaG n=1 Tax=Novosphingobium kunmingense TaxID=1211806 RepID=A0A2N0I470_9SPHN|nr:cytochrome c oxidase assembly protein [Novosphingobium kunmingense]PKB25978.1 cytochrome c oxidase assembly protein subunit 11 [Novosphingobium kunmingense]